MKVVFTEQNIALDDQRPHVVGFFCKNRIYRFFSLGHIALGQCGKGQTQPTAGSSTLIIDSLLEYHESLSSPPRLKFGNALLKIVGFRHAFTSDNCANNTPARPPAAPCISRPKFVRTAANPINPSVASKIR